MSLISCDDISKLKPKPVNATRLRNQSAKDDQLQKANGA